MPTQVKVQFSHIVTLTDRWHSPSSDVRSFKTAEGNAGTVFGSFNKYAIIKYPAFLNAQMKEV